MKRTRTPIVLVAAAAFVAITASYQPLAGAVALAILVAIVGRRLDALERKSEQLALLIEVGQRLQRSTTLDEALDIVRAYAARLLPSSGGRLHISAAGAVTLRGPRTAEVARLAETLSDQIALAVANLRLHETLRTRAVRDALTGLFNRCYLEETLVRCLRDDAPVGVIIADVDRFKQFNDSWGHAGGDALLQQLARLMQRVFDEQHVICRFGGDEFVIVLPGTTPDALYAGAERLCREARHLQVHLDGQLLDAVTVSVGVALAPGDATTSERILAAADRALYAAKSNGRDRVAGPPPHAVIAFDAA